MTAELREKLTRLEEYGSQLERALERTSAGSDWLVVRALERLIQLCVECCADAGDLWLGQNGLALGESAAGVFRRLHEAGALDGPAHDRFRRYVSARNRIIHDYSRVVETETLSTARGLVDDARALARRLAGNGG